MFGAWEGSFQIRMDRERVFSYSTYLIDLEEWIDIEESILGNRYCLNKYLEAESSNMSRDRRVEQLRDWIIGQNWDSLVRETGN